MVVSYGRVIRHSTLISFVKPPRLCRPPSGYYRGISSSCCLRNAATTVQHSQDALRTRNIGIIAHIDAGKTTTTERMLYYSGHTRRIGDVDEGSTVTDFLPAERARGITIQSAAITFEWPPADAAVPPEAGVAADAQPKSPISHNINLIDTPGHADFTFEVRRSLRILDGAVCILDGVAGVEAQTEQVWAQAGEWKIPRIAYINKLDRDGAAFGRTVREIGSRLAGWPAVCQIPWFEGGKGRFTGIGDVVNLEGLLYEPGGTGKAFQRLTLSQLDQEYPELADELRRARVAVVELLSEHDDELVEAFFEAEEDHLKVIPAQLLQALRRCLLADNSRIIPVFAGASFRNIGVQPLLDAISNLLPSPIERPDPEISLGSSSGGLSQLIAGKLAVSNDSGKAKKKSPATTSIPIGKTLQGCALAFKVVNDPRKGVLVYIRVYSGSIERNALLYNTNLQNSERASTLLRMYASESVPVQTLNAGEIGVIAGSKFARTGDTLISYTGNKATPPEPLNKLQLRPIKIPPPVFFAAIEPNSLRAEKDMHEKLALLLREDPSLQISQDEDTGQTQISGMGELHLEIAQDRLVNEMKAEARMGKIAIGYRESLPGASKPITKTLEGDRIASKGKAGCTAVVEPLQDTDDKHEDVREDIFSYEQDGNIIAIATPTLDSRGRPIDADNVALPPNLILPEIQQAYINGALAALSRGPSYSYPMRNTKVTLTLRPGEHTFGSETSYASLTSAARLATIAAFKDATKSTPCSLMEPVMNVDINVDEASLGTVIQDISSSRGGQIVSLGDHEDELAEEGSISRRIDVSKIYAPKDPFESGSSVSGEQHDRVSFQRSIKAKVPLKEMVGYLKHLRSMTGGRGTFVMSVDRFERVTGPREKALIAELRGGV
ncbi:Ribosome-releasing factor 2, mitochondrial [Exophiala sideris]|uniref:Ribosome-releasing factor 2, mitochondrial n=1 Tax=Exophiala sideris TaxID=1016849 RepID=A0ABR0JEE9_9EURO|nr:Ribosome-releasing factor 2, mitochondrial [Exophiala sideris]KAK5037242.1 Ribosome-releasing factor 2, mitochondrial [Exophiala sideris]KAK5062103.1 Ribosome-releasing factor 2, mitochondrial [Exophiala sideris]KAK5182400.1 Ribosome-releasing factor 2, mitochondrial [Eurotiomycetes sp. CCFEE 6388]